MIRPLLFGSDVVLVDLFVPGPFVNPDDVVAVNHSIIVIDGSGCYLPGFACQKAVKEDVEVALALISPDHIVAADVRAAVVKTVIGYVPFLIGSGVMQINVEVSVPVVRPDDIIP